MEFEIGPGVRCNVAELIDKRALVQATSGAGKSWLLRRILEQTHGKRVQQLVIDPEGEFVSLRERFDFVLAGKGGDTAADPRSASLLAEKLWTLGASAILDISELKAHERTRFVKLFCETLVEQKKDTRHSCMVVIDEAHLFVPEGSESESTGAVIDLVTRGRKRGLCAVLATQRLSKVSKDAAAELGTRFVGRTTLDIDVQRATDLLGFTRKGPEARSLMELKDGEFFTWGHSLTPSVVTRVHVGPVVTTHPKGGARLTMRVPPPTSEIRKLLPTLADLPAEAEERLKTVADLHAEVRSLNAQLRARPKEQVEKAITKRVEVLIIKDAQIKRLEGLVARAEKVMGGATGFREALELGVHAIKAALAQARMPPPAAERLTPTRPLVSAASNRPALAPRKVAPPTEGVSKPQQVILDSLAYFESIGVMWPSRRQVALVSKVSSVSSGYEKNVSTLRTLGLIDYPSQNMLGLTEAGRGAARAPEMPPTTDELHQAIYSRVSQPQAAILKALVRAYPGALSREELASQAGQSDTSSGFEKNVSTLKSLGLAHYPGQGTVAAQPVLFLEGAA